MTPEEQDRYSRHILLDGFGDEAQQRLGQASVLIIGAGALGTIVGMYLAGAGVGHIHIVDPDTIGTSNLQRQPPFTVDDIGKAKAEALAAHLRRLNPSIEVTESVIAVTADNIGKLIAPFDLVVEASDNVQTKVVVTGECECQNKPYVLAGVAQYNAQVLAWQPGASPYSAIFPDTVASAEYKTAAQGGVFSPTAAVAASIEAAEAIKLLAGIGTPLHGKLITYNALTSRFQEFFY